MFNRLIEYDFSKVQYFNNEAEVVGLVASEISNIYQ